MKKKSGLNPPEDATPGGSEAGSKTIMNAV